MSDDEGWTVVRSKREQKEDYKLHKEITEKIKESEIMGKYKIFYRDTTNQYRPKCILNKQIGEDPKFLDYVKYRFVLCDNSSKSDRLVEISDNTRRELTTYFLKKK